MSSETEIHPQFEESWDRRRTGLTRRLHRATAPPAPGGESEERNDPVRQIRNEVKERVLDELDRTRSSGFGTDDEAAIRTQIRRLLNEELDSRRGTRFRERDRREIEKLLVDEMLGAGVLQPLLDDPTLSDILVNGPDEVWVDRYGRLEKTTVRFDSEKHLLHILNRMVEKHGRHLEESSPYVDARLPDGSRLHAIIPPLSEIGPVVSIRRARTIPLSLEEILGSGSLTREMTDFIAIAVQRRLNILFTGGASTGKTSLLNIFSRYIPTTERVVTIEETRELRLEHPHTISLETRSANTEGIGEIDLRTLVRNALRMRADRIIVGEVRGTEVFEMLQAMNVGHEGSLSTLHANNPRDAVRRLEGLAQLSGLDIPSRTIKEMIISTIDLIVQLERSSDGSRRVVSIAEVGFENESGGIRDLFLHAPEKGFHAACKGPLFNERLGLPEDEILRLFGDGPDDPTD